MKMSDYYGSVSPKETEDVTGVETSPSIKGWVHSGSRLHNLEPKRPKTDHMHHDNAPGGTSLLGLRLTKTPSFAELIETKLYKHTDYVKQKIHKRNKAQSQFEKLKASNISALSLQIGPWKRVASYDGDLVAKCYFAKQKLVWEVLCGGLKSKMEIQWLQISAIRAIFVKGHPDNLEIELQKPPMYFYESSPQPRKHTMWVNGDDFTGGQAEIFKRHTLQFPEGTLEEHYEKLLQCDSRLQKLSLMPFPAHNSPFFDLTPKQNQAIDPRTQNPYHQSHGTIFETPQPHHHIPVVCDSQSTMLYKSVSSSNQGNNFQPIHDGASTLNQNMRYFEGQRQQRTTSTNYNLAPTGLKLSSIAHQLLSEPQPPVDADERSLLVKVSSIGSALYELETRDQNELMAPQGICNQNEAQFGSALSEFINGTSDLQSDLLMALLS